MVPASSGLRGRPQHSPLVPRTPLGLRGDDDLRSVRPIFRSRLCLSSTHLYLLFNSGIVVTQTVRDGFRFRPVDEIAEKRHEIEEAVPEQRHESLDEKKGSVEYVDIVP